MAAFSASFCASFSAFSRSLATLAASRSLAFSAFSRSLAALAASRSLAFSALAFSRASFFSSSSLSFASFFASRAFSFSSFCATLRASLSAGTSGGSGFRPGFLAAGADSGAGPADAASAFPASRDACRARWRFASSYFWRRSITPGCLGGLGPVAAAGASPLGSAAAGAGGAGGGTRGFRGIAFRSARAFASGARPAPRSTASRCSYSLFICLAAALHSFRFAAAVARWASGSFLLPRTSQRHRNPGVSSTKRSASAAPGAPAASGFREAKVMMQVWTALGVTAPAPGPAVRAACTAATSLGSGSAEPSTRQATSCSSSLPAGRTAAAAGGGGLGARSWAT